MTKPATERRAHPRKPLGTKIEGKVSGRAFIALTSDISGSGIFLYTANPFEVGETVNLSFVLPAAKGPIRAPAVVIRVAEGKGMGLQFTSLAPADLATIRAFVTANQ